MDDIQCCVLKKGDKNSGGDIQCRVLKEEGNKTWVIYCVVYGNRREIERG